MPGPWDPHGGGTAVCTVHSTTVRGSHHTLLRQQGDLDLAEAREGGGVQQQGLGPGSSKGGGGEGARQQGLGPGSSKGGGGGFSSRDLDLAVAKKGGGSAAGTWTWQ